MRDDNLVRARGWLAAETAKLGSPDVLAALWQRAPREFLDLLMAAHATTLAAAVRAKGDTMTNLVRDALMKLGADSLAAGIAVHLRTHAADVPMPPVAP